MSNLAVSTRWLQGTVQGIRTATTVAGLTLLVGFGAMGVVAEPSAPADADRLGMSSGPLDALMQENRCSVTGFNRDIIPSKAIVRTPEGETELVSFDRGWAVFSGQVAGELVAVCLGPETSAAS